MIAVLIMPEVDYPAMDHFEPSIGLVHEEAKIPRDSRRRRYSLAKLNRV